MGVVKKIDIQYVPLLTTNCLIFRDVNVNSQLILWKNGRILNESKLNLVDPDYYRTPTNYVRFLLLNHLKRKQKSIPGKTVWVVDQWAVNYYHWFVEALTKVLSTRLDRSDFVVMLPSTFRNLGYHEESLTLLGIRSEYFDVVTERLHCEEMYLPLNVSINGTTNPLYINKLRDALLSDRKNIRPARRLYVSRRSAGKRRVANEAEVTTFLQPYGFEVVEFEKMTFKEQLAICNSATIIVGLHGAGLTNMLFMTTGKAVIELRRENEDNFCFKYLAEALNMRYDFVECKNQGDDRYNSDFSVNLAELKKMIEARLLPE